MKKYISVIVSLILSCCLLSCTEEQWLKNGGVTEQQGGLPIEFVMEFAPTQPLTRADGTEITIEGEKTAFENGDIIQIVANFYCKDTDGDNKVLMPEESICTMLQYQKSESDDMGKWVNYKAENDKDRPLYWPWKSEEATFQAFYYPGFNGYIDGTTLPVLLDSVDVKTNPLMTQETARIPYGNAVPLTFKHICARLVLTDLEDVTGGASYTNLWLENLSKTPLGTNAFKLSLKEKNEETNPDPENGKLSFECSFTSEQNEEEKVLIGGKSATITTNNGTSPNETAIIFFLPAGNYSKAALTRRFGRPLLNWNNVVELNQLVAGTSYIVSLNELKGNITIEDDDDWWEDDKKPIKPEEGYFDLNTFLQCIHDGKSYSYNDSNGKKITVLEKGQDNQLYLTQNINFDNQDFTSQTIPQAVILNGNGHYFSYVKKSVFSQINGEVHNLGFKNCTASVDLTKTGINNYRFGILTNTNYGIIDNIRLSEISIHVNSIEDGGTYEVGSLVGNSQNTISNIELDNIRVTTTNEPNVNSATFAFGGLIGQTTKGGTLEKVTMYTDKNIVVKNSIKLKKGNIYTGGLIGLSSSNIKECSVRADVSTAEATGVWIYTGGLVGSMRNQIQGSSGSDTDTSTGDSTDTLTEDNTDTSTGDEGHILLEFSQNIGTVTGGECIGQDIDGTISTGHSATGGLVGYSLRADIKNCIVDGKVTSYIGENRNDATHAYEFYTIGGLAGAVRAADKENKNDYPKVENNSVYADIDSKLDIDEENPTVHFCKVGWLAGIAPTNVEEEISNIKFVSTTYKKVGYPSDNAPSTSSSRN